MKRLHMINFCFSFCYSIYLRMPSIPETIMSPLLCVYHLQGDEHIQQHFVLFSSSDLTSRPGTATMLHNTEFQLCSNYIQGWELFDGRVCLKIFSILKWYIISLVKNVVVYMHLHASMMSDWPLPDFDVTG